MPGDGCRLDRRDLRTAAERPRPEPRCPRGLCPDLRAGPPNRPARLPPVRAGYGGRRALQRRGRFRRRPTGRTARDFLRAAVTPAGPGRLRDLSPPPDAAGRSEEHTSELQSHSDLVCRLLLEKKKACMKTRAAGTPSIPAAP